MTLQGQLAQSARSAAFQSPPWPPDFLSTSSLDNGLLGNASIQILYFSYPRDAGSGMEYYRRFVERAHGFLRLATLKKEVFTDEGKQQRIEKSLAALNAPQPTVLTAAEWKALIEEIEDDED